MPTGAFSTDVEPKDDYQVLVDFLKKAHPVLRSADEVLLYASDQPIDLARAAFKERVKSFEYPTKDQVTERLRSDANIPA